MKAILTLDDKNGMMFNNRRQSRDSAVNQKICNIVNEKTLFISPYSEKLFDGLDVCKNVSDDFLTLAEKDDFCFIENVEVPIEDCEELLIFRWNRIYPADRFFNVDLVGNGFSLKSSEELVGSSHEKITLDIFKKGE